LKPVPPTSPALRLVLLGDGQSPHLLKWARALMSEPDVELWAVSSRDFMPDLAALLPAPRRLALCTTPAAGGGNVALLRTLPHLVRWLRRVQPHVLHAHYLTSHGTLALAAQRLGGVGGVLVGSAWGSDILVTPTRGRAWRWLTQRVLAACALSTSDSQVMAARMRALGAREVMVFPFGLEAMLPPPPVKEPGLFFANRGLEPIYRPARVLEVFAAFAGADPACRLVVANDGSLRVAMQAQAAAMGLAARVRFVGRLDAAAQAVWYDRAECYLSLPQSDSVAVSLLEAMAHGCIPIVSDLPANRELIDSGVNGLVLADDVTPDAQALAPLRARAAALAADNRAWVQQHALFGPAVQAFVQRLRAFGPR